MDTESFLIARAQLVKRLETRRLALSHPENGSEPPPRLFGWSLPPWGSWLIRLATRNNKFKILEVLLSAGLPLLMGFARGQGLSFLMRKTLSSRWGDFVSRLWKRS
jgi:hypothetical protein